MERRLTKKFSLNRGRVSGAFATKTVDLGSIRGRIKPKTLKINICSFPVYVKKRIVCNLPSVQ